MRQSSKAGDRLTTIKQMKHTYVVDRGTEGPLTVEADSYCPEGDFVTFFRDLGGDATERVASIRAATVISVRESEDNVNGESAGGNVERPDRHGACRAGTLTV
jgi:hypothetical protein